MKMSDMDPAAALEEAPEVSVVVPAFNEEESLPELVREVFMSLEGLSCRMIIVDDGSNDGTWDRIVELSSRYPVTGLRFSVNCGKAA
ncbi:MAG: glycosyltransferase, partial [Candidatus Fermentibacteraceae bacterium]|nr:glycosyltransferase [Candidatus Fermentibacteraceae bacterium]